MGRLMRWLGRVLWMGRQAVIVLMAVAMYFGIRGTTVGSFDIAKDHAGDIVALERWLGLYVEPEISAPVAASDPLATVANTVYIYGHWPVIAVAMLWLAWRHRPHFLRLRDGMIVSGILGMVVYVSYPVAPPRLAGLGMVDTVTERSEAYRVLQPPAFVNQYAAMPSLHVGWNLLVGVAVVFAGTGVVLRVIGGVLPVIMAISVVVTANHYILDVVAGIALVLLGHYVASLLQRRRERLRAAEEPTEPERVEAL